MNKKIKPGTLDQNAVYVEQFLKYHGYIESSHDLLPTAIKKFQLAHGLPDTGKLNHQTCRLFNSSRCGNPERGLPIDALLTGSLFKEFPPMAHRMAIVEPDTHEDLLLRNKTEYDFIAGWWPSRELRFALVGGPPEPVLRTAWDSIRAAFQTWNLLNVLEITEVGDPREAEIRVVWTFDGHTPDGNGFGTRIAKAFYPLPNYEELAGDIFFNANETWSTDGVSGFDVETVALHEIGHSLGIGHANFKESAMYFEYHQVMRDLHALDKEYLTLKYRDQRFA